MDCVYAFFDGPKIVYIGMTDGCAAGVIDGKRRALHKSKSPWWTPELEFRVLSEHERREEATIREAELIRECRPVNNVAHNPNRDPMPKRTATTIANAQRGLERPPIWPPPTQPANIEANMASLIDQLKADEAERRARLVAARATVVSDSIWITQRAGRDRPPLAVNLVSESSHGVGHLAYTHLTL